MSVADLVADAHAHAHHDLSALTCLPSIATPRVALMGVSLADWSNVESATRLLGPHRAIPCFGIHPWWAHLHATRACPDRLHCFATRRGDRLGEGAISAVDPETVRALSLEDAVPRDVWEGGLRARLTRYPGAVVGELGLDRSAVLPGTRWLTRLEHQMELVDTQLDIATTYNRPVSIHCVQAHGALLDLLNRRGGDCLPPKVMLHAYGGSREMIRRLLALPDGVGERIYFSFNQVIQLAKQDVVLGRIAAVPDDRVLAESDQTHVDRVDVGMEASVALIAAAKGWRVEEATQRLQQNFDKFYDGCHGEEA